MAKAPEKRPSDAYAVYERLLPFLPLPGTQPSAVERGPAGMPDPTLVYRRPNAPRPRAGATPQHQPPVPSSPPPGSVLTPELKGAIRAAMAQSDALLDQERFSQAAEVLDKVIVSAGAALGTESSRVLKLRSRRAAILVVGGDVRRALPEFDALAAAHMRISGPASTDALECLRQAAHCRAELGQTTKALAQFQQVLTQVRATDGDASPTALDLRRNIGMLLLSEGRTTEAAARLQPLYDDLCVVYGPAHEESREVADILARLRMSGRDWVSRGRGSR